MFRIITPENRNEHQGLLGDMYRMRHRIIVGEWGWDIPGIPEGYDKDQFDTDNTVYVIVQTEYGDVVATSRMNPTTQPHMLSDLFTDHCDLQPYPVGPSVWECSRFVTDRSLTADLVEDFRIHCRLGIGLTVFCLDNGISRVSWLTHQKFYNLAQRVWKTEPLGLPKREGDDWAWIPAVSQIDQVTLDRQMDRYRNAEQIVAECMAPKRYVTG